MKNKRVIKVSPEFYKFIENLNTNRIKVGSEKKSLYLCETPDIVVKYFKKNNERYLELCKMERNDGIE